MTREELKNIMQIIQTEYTDFGKINQDKFNFWYDCLKDYDAGIMKEALCRHARESNFSPRIAGLVKQYNLILDEMRREERLILESFDHISHVYPYGDMREAEKAFREFAKRTDREQAADRLLFNVRESMMLPGELKPLAELIRSLE